MTHQIKTIEIEGAKLDLTNEEFNNAIEFVQHTNKLVYLTGKAGTGKTTFLKYIKESINKNTVILAPTGVAAINAGGQTIHSFFQIEPSIYIPDDNRLRTKANKNDADKSTIYDHFRYRKELLKIINGMELLIIDEVSMLRCDLLDVVDKLLRVFRENYVPFGGVQVILIGDTFQLPPVVKPEDDEILSKFYESPFFFSAKVIKENTPVYIELKKIYRQNEQEFIDLLNRVRVNQITQNEITLLNSRFKPLFNPPENDNYIILATHKKIVDNTNLTKLEELQSELKLYEATVTGIFHERDMPTDRILQLKEGAQVMFVKNDKGVAKTDTEGEPVQIMRYYNGKMAKIIQINDNGIVAEFSEGNKIAVERETWENVRYTWNEKEKKIEKEIIGTFTQYPVKLAWAITVHKSQGLTFEKVIADLGAAFAPGQVYVALSRCTTFNGLVFKTQLHKSAIKTAPEVLAFAQNEIPGTLLTQTLTAGKADFYYKKVRESLKQFKFEEAYDNLMSAIKYRNDMETDVFKRYYHSFALKLASYKKGYDSAIIELDVLKTENTDLQLKNKNLKEIVYEQKNKISEQNNAVKLLLDKMQETETVNANQNETIETLQSELDDKEILIEQMENNRKRLSENLKNGHSKIRKYESEIISLKQEIERLRHLKWYQKLIGKK
jgi:uncharacterized coiled-coil protein SlyX/nucleoside-triphosphatase THEP1